MSAIGLYERNPETDLPLIDRVRGLVRDGCLVHGPAGSRPSTMPASCPRIGDPVTVVVAGNREPLPWIIRTTVRCFWGGETVYGERGPGVFEPCTEAVPYEGSSGYHLYASGENGFYRNPQYSAWLRGHYADDSPEVRALLVTLALTRGE